MRILLTEEDRVTRRSLRTKLVRWGYDVVTCLGGSEAWEVLREENAPQLAIIGQCASGLTALDVCRKVRLRGSDPYIYLILLTAVRRADAVVEGLDSGADDIITKPFHTYELQARLRAGKRIIDLERELTSARDGYRLRALHDPLTGLLNRSGIMELLQREIEHVALRNTPVSVILSDLDHFKQVNDTYGHQIGDAVLREAACRMRSCLRGFDAVARFGGEEFLVVLPACSGPDAFEVAERIRVTLSANPIIVGDRCIPVTIRLGVTECRGNHETDSETLIHAADVALYQAKNGGRNQSGFFTPTKLSPNGLSAT